MRGEPEKRRDTRGRIIAACVGALVSMVAVPEIYRGIRGPGTLSSFRPITTTEYALVVLVSAAAGALLGFTAGVLADVLHFPGRPSGKGRDQDTEE